MAVVSADSSKDRAHEEAVERVRLGMLVFLASDIMLFAPFFAAYFLLRANGGPWPPAGAHLDTVRAAVATVVLVSSSGTIVVAERAAERGNLRSMRIWLGLTMALGGAFLVNQVVEYLTLPFKATDHPYGSIYWLLTGLHGAHVTTGLLAIGALWLRTLRVRRPADLDTWTASISVLWHLVDVIWVAVFFTIWIIR